MARAVTIGGGWRVAAVLAAAHALANADRMLVPLLAEPLRHDLALSDGELGLAQGLGFAGVYAVAMVPMTLAGARLGRRAMLALVVALWSMGTAACGLAGGFASLVSARALMGLAQAGLMPTAMALLVAHLPRASLGRGIAAFTASAAAGRGLGLIGGGALLSIVVATGALPGVAPWRTVFLAMAALGLVFAPVVFALPRGATTTTARTRLGPAWRWMTREDAGAGWLAWAAACIVICTGTLAAWVPSLMSRTHGLSPAGAGYLVGLVTIVAAPVGHLLGGLAVDRLTVRPARAATLIAAALAAATLPLAVLVWTHDPVIALVGLGIATILLTIGAPAALAAVQLRAPEGVRGGVSAIFFTLSAAVGSGLGPSAAGALSDVTASLPLALAIVLAAGAGGGCLCATMAARPTATR